MGDNRQTPYKRLPGRGPRKRGFTVISRSRCSLYMGDDHVLAVDNRGFTEDYKRFYFSDIQAIVTERTKRGAIWNTVLAVLIVCSLAGMLFPAVAPVRIFLGSFSGVFLLFLVINLLRGPTCVCHITTAVQEDLLPSLNRLSVARKSIGTLTEAIEKVQGRLSSEEVIARSNEVADYPLPHARERWRPGNQQNHLRHYRGTIHMIAFALMVTDGIAIIVNILHHTMAMSVVSTLLTAAYWVCVIISLVKQHESDIPGSLKKITWTSFVYVCVSLLLGYITMVYSTVTHQLQGGLTQWDMYRAMLAVSPHDSPLVMAVHGFSVVCSLILGLLGLIGVIGHRSTPVFESVSDSNQTGDPAT